MTTMQSYVDIEPLQPPFSGRIARIRFRGMEKELAVSAADYARICELLGPNPTDRLVVLSACEDDVHIRVAVRAS